MILHVAALLLMLVVVTMTVLFALGALVAWIGGSWARRLGRLLPCWLFGS